MQDAQGLVIRALLRAMTTMASNPMDILSVDTGIPLSALEMMVPRAAGILAMTRSLGDM